MSWFSQQRLVRIGVSVTLSVLLWTSVKLTKNYRSALELPVAYEGIPRNLQLEAPLPSTLSVDVAAVGHQLALAKFGVGRDTLRLNLQPYLAQGALATQLVLPALAQQLPEALALEGIRPDTLYFRVSGRLRKQVPVVSRVRLETGKGYRLTDPVRFLPDSVMLLGTAKELRSLVEWPTVGIGFGQLTESVTATVPLERSNSLTVTPEAVSVELKVDRFTEKRIRVPVRVTNVPPGYQVRLLSGGVEVVLLVPLQRYDEVGADDFAVVVDYRSLRPEDPRAFPAVVRAPRFVQGVRLEPGFVPYVIRVP